MSGHQYAPASHEHGALHHVFQFSDIARIEVILKHKNGFIAETHCGESVLMAINAQEMFREGDDIRASLAQRRNGNSDHVQAIKQIFAEHAFAYGSLEIAVGGGEDAKVAANCFGAAHAFKGALLQDTQQFRLQGWGEFADFIQEDRATFGHLESASLSPYSPLNPATIVTKQFRFEKVFRDRGAIDHDEWLVLPLTVVGNGFGAQLLTSSRFTADQNRRIRFRALSDHNQDIQHRPSPTQEAARAGRLALSSL